MTGPPPTSSPSDPFTAPHSRPVFCGMRSMFRVDRAQRWSVRFRQIVAVLRMSASGRKRPRPIAGESRSQSHYNNVSLTRAADLTVRFPSRISPKTHFMDSTQRLAPYRASERVDQDVDVCEFKTGLPSGQAKRRCHPDLRLAEYRRRHGTPAVKPRVARTFVRGARASLSPLLYKRGQRHTTAIRLVAGSLQKCFIETDSCAHASEHRRYAEYDHIPG
jgi:hypothetical protein